MSPSEHIPTIIHPTHTHEFLDTPLSLHFIGVGRDRDKVKKKTDLEGAMLLDDGAVREAMDSCRNHRNTVPSPESGRALSFSPIITTNWWLPPRALLRDLVPQNLPRGEAERPELTHCWGQLASNELLSCLHRVASSALSSRQRQYRSRAPQHTCLSFMDGAAISAGLPGLVYNPRPRRGGPEPCSPARPPEEQPTWESAVRSSAPGPQSRPASPRTTRGNVPPAKRRLIRVDPSRPPFSTQKGVTSGCAFRPGWARPLGGDAEPIVTALCPVVAAAGAGVEGPRVGGGDRAEDREEEEAASLRARTPGEDEAQVGHACKPLVSAVPRIF